MVLGLLMSVLTAHAAEAWPLTELAEDMDLELPTLERPLPDGPIPVTGPWRVIATVDGVRTWEAPLPVRPRTLFYFRPPQDMALFQSEAGAQDFSNGQQLNYAYRQSDAGKANTWAFTDRALHVRRSASDGPPAVGEYGVRYSRAIERASSLHPTESGLSPSEFVSRSLQVDDTTRTGLLLPAPARASIDLDLPNGAVFDLSPMLLPPEAADPAERSDGARLVVTIQVDGEVTVLHDAPVPFREPSPLQLDLSEWGGRTARLTLETDPGISSALDHVFVADPIVHIPDENAPRIVLVFIDTLRQDHLSTYGYARQTTPRIDARAAKGAVFEQARSVAPWTLPSSRTMLTGHQPELWDTAPRIQETLGAEGWATGFIAGNVYLSSNFGMASGWTSHRCVNWPVAEVQVDRALEFLAEHPDRPAFLELHLMDMHLPYTEPLSYRGKFAGDVPDSLSGAYFHRSEITKAGKKLGEEGRQYVRDRYDNNLAYIDDQLDRVFSLLGPDDTVIIVSDHGEEFWDHGGFEHGHTLYDELLRVPMMMWGPGIAPGRHAEPVSLLDVAPTIAVAAGLEPKGMEGVPLQSVVDRSRAEDVAGRPQSFGRPLYGVRQWGVAHDGHKYTTREGAEHLYDLVADPDEKVDILEGGAAIWRSTMGKGLGRDVGVGYRIAPNRSKGGTDLVVELIVPGGVREAIVADDPTMGSEATVEVIGETVRATWSGKKNGTRELFVLPTAPLEDATSALQMRVIVGSAHELLDLSTRQNPPPPMAGQGGRLGKAKAGGRSVTLGYAVVPLPHPDGAGIAGYDDEVKGELQALGYVEPD